VKLRHYGLLAPGNVNTRLTAARALLEAKSHAPASAPVTPMAAPDEPVSDWRTLLLRLFGVDVTRCHRCGGESASRCLTGPQLRDSS
jgi:hypothetical protein